MGTIDRRQLIQGAGLAAGAVLVNRAAEAQSTAAPVLFTRTLVVTPDRVYENAALAVENGAIAAIGPSGEVEPRYPHAEIYDGRGKAILPGLINCHAHLAETLGRGFNEDFGFPNASHLKVRPQSLLRGDEKTLMVMMGALECIKGGTTAVVEFAGGIAPYAASLAQSGLRLVFAESIADSESVRGPMSEEALLQSTPPRFSQSLREAGLQRLNDLFSTWHGRDGRVSVFPAASLSETCSPELLKAVRAFAEAHDLGYSIHLSQSRPEVAYMNKVHGVSPVGFLGQNDFLGPRLFAAHCRYVDEDDIALLGRSGTIISHQAAMAANRGVIPPIAQLRRAGCVIANGTDNNTNDMLEVMRIALVTARIRGNRPDDPNPGMRPQPEDMLEDATEGGAQALRQKGRIGRLAVGARADLIVLDTQRAHLVPAGRILSAWIHNGQPSDVESSMVDGRFVMKDRKVLTLDEAALIAEADKVGKRVWNEVKAQGPIPVPGRT